MCVLEKAVKLNVHFAADKTQYEFHLQDISDKRVEANNVNINACATPCCILFIYFVIKHKSSLPENIQVVRFLERS